MKFLLLSLGTLLLAFSFNGFGCPLCKFKAEEPKESNVKALTCQLKVDGMTCAACVKAVEKALKSLEGVKEAQVDLKGGRASVKYDDAKVKPAQFIKAIKDAGFTATEIK